MGTAEEQLGIEDYLRRHIHWPFLEAGMSGMKRAYQKAASIVADNCPGRQGREAVPQMRRVLIDQSLRFEARKFSKFVSACEKENRAHNSVHVEVRCGLLTFTQHFLGSPKSSPRDAVYRSELSGMPGQYELFGAPKISADARLYAQILHGCTGTDNGKERGAPDFAYIKLPLPGCVEYSAELFDLMQEFPHVFGRERSALLMEGQVTDEAEPKLRPQEGAGDAG